MEHIHPIYDHILSRAERETFLGQKSKVIWLTGLSGSGKSTIAVGLEKKLFAQGFFAQVLDGDNIRHGINANLGFSTEDRQENIRRIAEVAKLYKNSGVITICSFISPTIDIRQMARDIIGVEDFIEVFVDTPLEICEQRDVKGLYKKARAGEITGFTGIDSPYEPPPSPSIVVVTDHETIEESVNTLMKFIKPVVWINDQRSTTNEPADKGVNEPLIQYNRFEDLEIWKEGMLLAKKIYQLFRDINDYGFKNQIYRAAVSVPSNIAEGHERNHNKENIQFLYIAKGSCGEVRTQLILAKELKYLENKAALDLIDDADKLSRKLANYIKARKNYI